MKAHRTVSLTLLAVGAALVLLPELAPATIEEQRARLPPPATCTDPVEGVWMSHKYNPDYDEWMIFTLWVHRGADNQLSGNIEGHAWFGGGPRASEPPACSELSSHWVVAMTALGTVAERRIEFWGTAWHVQQVFCGPQHIGYNLDHFTGTIDPAIMEFQSVNNDGGRAINDPTVFRRVRCLDPVSPPHPYVQPPDFHPPRRRGCGR